MAYYSLSALVLRIRSNLVNSIMDTGHVDMCSFSELIELASVTSFSCLHSIIIFCSQLPLVTFFPKYRRHKTKIEHKLTLTTEIAKCQPALFLITTRFSHGTRVHIGQRNICPFCLSMSKVP